MVAVSTGFCLCPCHSAMLGDANDAMQRGDAGEAARITGLIGFDLPPWANVENVLEAAVASGCSCLKNHAPALAKRPPKYDPPRPWSPDDE